MLDEAIERAIGHHRAGRLAEAEAHYREIIARRPRDSRALHSLGVLAGQTGRLDVAIDLIRRSIAIDPSNAEAHCNLGSLYRNQGDLNRALSSYQDALDVQPDYVDAHVNLAGISQDSGRLEPAIAAYRRAISLAPDHFEAHNNLGVALHCAGKIEEALDAWRRAIEVRPESAEGQSNLGNALLSLKRVDESITCYREAIRLRPDYAEAHSNLANALQFGGQIDAAIAECRIAIRLNPEGPEAHNTLAIALQGQGKLDEAIAACRDALRIRPSYVEAHTTLGNALLASGRFEESVAAYRAALGLRPDCAEAWNNLGNALSSMGQIDEAVVAYREALALKPGYADAHNNLGSAYKERGQAELAVASYRQAVALKPGFTDAHSNLVYSVAFDPGYDAQQLLAELRAWDRQHGQPLKPHILTHENDRSPDRRLRIGYVSADFRDHVVGRNIWPLLREHDRDQFEIFCYSNVQRPDALSERMRSFDLQWRNLAGVNDEAAAKLIREDRIDILVDLSLHMAGSRLPLFARKPAPVQVTFGGYPGGTGLETMDYRLTDRHLDPPGVGDDDYREESIRLAHSFWCYDPEAMTLAFAAPPEVSELPALRTGAVTFGYLGNFCKVNDGMLSLWARLLRRLQSSRLLLLAPTGTAREEVLDHFRREGIDRARVRFVDYQRRELYLRQYHRVDVALDTLPYNGHTTSLDALWMGVPVVTLVGRTVVGRAGLSQLTNLGLPELITHDEEQYIEIAMKLAGDLERLAKLRASLRDRMRHSPLCDARNFTREIESALRQIWHR